MGPEPDILVDSCNDLEIVDVLFKSLQVQSKLAGNLKKLLVVQALEILEKTVVILPEHPLSSRRECSNRRPFGECMLCKGEVFEDQFHL